MPGYLNDILGLLNMRGQYELGHEDLLQRAKEFQTQFGLTKEEADRAAQQWQQQFGEQQARRQFEQQQQQNAVQRQMAQQDYQNRWADWSRGNQIGAGGNNDLVQLLSGSGRGLFGSDQLDAIYRRFGLPGLNQPQRRL